MDKLDSFLTALGAAAACLAAIAPTEETRILCFCALGAVAGGYVSASINTDATQGEATRRTTLARRWAVNFAAGLICGPVTADYLSDQYPDFNKIYVALFSGGACGVLAVSLLCILIPWILNRLKSEANKKLP